MKKLIAALILIALMGVGETTLAAAPSRPTACAARTQCRTATSPSASTAAEVPFDCKRWPPNTRRWKRFGYSICMNGPGWERVRVRCFHPRAGEVYIRFGFFVRSHQVNPNNDLSIAWCPAGAYARGVRIQRIPEVGPIVGAS